jgi:hypothetical protein
MLGDETAPGRELSGAAASVIQLALMNRFDLEQFHKGHALSKFVQDFFSWGKPT